MSKNTNYYRILRGTNNVCYICKGKKESRFRQIYMYNSVDSIIRNIKTHVECEYEWLNSAIKLHGCLSFRIRKDKELIEVPILEFKKELLRRFKTLILQEI